MKKRLLAIAFILLFLSGCANRPMTVLPKNPMEFKQFEVSNPRDKIIGSKL